MSDPFRWARTWICPTLLRVDACVCVCAGSHKKHTLKTGGWGMWLRESLLPVALERPAEGFEAFERFEGGQTAGSNALKNRWLGRGCESCCQLPWKGLRKGLKRLSGLRAGKRQARTPLKTDGWAWLRELLPVALERPAEGFEAFERFEGGQTAGSNPLKNRWLGVAARVVASCLGKAGGRVWSVWAVWRRANGRLEPS